MTPTDIFENRRSIRAFKSTPVPRALIEELLREAAWSPSWANTQPWEVQVVSGGKLERLTAALAGHVRSQHPQNPDFPMPARWPAPLQERVVRLGKELFKRVGIDRKDEEARAAHYERMYNGFGAPHLLLFTLDAALPLPYPFFDIGAFVQSFCLAAAARGLGTCILAALARYPDTVRGVLGLPVDSLVVVGVALGYPDEASSYNRFRSEREPLSSFVRWFS